MAMFNKGLLILLSMQYRYTFVDCVAHDVTIRNRNTERSSPVRVGETIRNRNTERSSPVRVGETLQLKTLL